MTPFRQLKGGLAQVGIGMPLIVAVRGVTHVGTINHDIVHVMDVAPTLPNIAGVHYPATFEGRTIASFQGQSSALISGGDVELHADDDALGWQMFGDRAIRMGNWQLLSLLERAGRTGDWQLFNLANDLAEMNDVSEWFPEKREALTDAWRDCSAANGVISSEAGPFARQH
jgi:arylsulfatase